MGVSELSLLKWSAVDDVCRIVERVVLHMVEPAPEEPSECLRVFVVFSGLAGAWRATRELDGRFFGGKKIVSRPSPRSSKPHALFCR